METCKSNQTRKEISVEVLELTAQYTHHFHGTVNDFTIWLKEELYQILDFLENVLSIDCASTMRADDLIAFLWKFYGRATAWAFCLL